MHFACHGVKDLDGQLYLTSADTELDDLTVTAIPADLLNRLVNRSPSRRIILVLDCCFSGAISRTVTYRGQDEVPVGDYFSQAGEGLVIMTASKAEEYAWEPSLQAVPTRDNPSHSVFSQALITGLGTGAADLNGDGEISFDELYTYVHARVAATGTAQTPMRWAFGHGTLIVAHALAGMVEAPDAVTAGPQAVTAGPQGVPDRPNTGLRSPWDAELLNWRHPVAPTVERLIRGPDRGGVERDAWGAARNGEWTRAAAVFRTATESDPHSASAWWGRAVGHAVAGQWQAAAVGFTRAADRAYVDGGSREALGFYAGATLLAAVTATAAGTAGDVELLGEAIDRVPFCPALLAYRAVLARNIEWLGGAFVLQPDLVADFAVVGIDVAEATRAALSEVERRVADFVRVRAGIDALHRQVGRESRAREPRTLFPQGDPRAPAQRRLRDYDDVVGSQRAALIEEIRNLHILADSLLANAMDHKTMALVEEVRRMIVAADGVLSLTDVPPPVPVLGVPPRLER